MLGLQLLEPGLERAHLRVVRLQDRGQLALSAQHALELEALAWRREDHGLGSSGETHAKDIL